MPYPTVSCPPLRFPLHCICRFGTFRMFDLFQKAQASVLPYDISRLPKTVPSLTSGVQALKCRCPSMSFPWLLSESFDIHGALQVIPRYLATLGACGAFQMKSQAAGGKQLQVSHVAKSTSDSAIRAATTTRIPNHRELRPQWQ